MTLSVQFSVDRPERESNRTKVLAAANYRKGMERASMQIADLSATGVKIQTVNPMIVGSRIWVKLPMLESLEAEVVWVNRFEAGCRFLIPLHPAVLQVLVQAHSK